MKIEIDELVKYLKRFNFYNNVKKQKNNNSNFNLTEFSEVMESINALLIQQKLTQAERLQQLNNTAIMQMQTLLNSKTLKTLNN